MVAPTFFDEVTDYVYGIGQQRQRSKDYFAELRSLARDRDAAALYHLGLLQKEGIGTAQRLKKARRSFEQAQALGDAEAAYGLGYFYLKGLGGLPQDYALAKHWFQRSDTPMARHWLAKMIFLGWGTPANKAKALKLLAANTDLYNSEVLTPQYKEATPPSDHKTPLLFQDTYSKAKAPQLDLLSGTWQGDFLELDPSGTTVMRSLPAQLQVNGSGVALTAQLQVGDSLATGPAYYTAGYLGLGGLRLLIAKQYTDHPNFTHMLTDFSGLALRTTLAEGKRMLLAKASADFPVWGEPAPPALLRLTKVVSADAEIQQAFAQQSNHFIRMWPNPIQERLLVNFELPKTAKVTISLREHYGSPKYQETLFKGVLPQGAHTLEVAAPPTAGLYRLLVTHNDKVSERILVKE
ncbi:MAG: hypothetical protein AAGF77_07150 [Bacteroidota bacterium]